MPTSTETVLTLCGAFGDPSSMPPMLEGKICRNKRVVPVPYMNWILDWKGADVLTAVDMLDDYIFDNISSGPVVVFGHSLGAVVAERWLKEKGPTSTYNPLMLRFVFVGNSMRRYGGVLFDTDYAHPTDTPYTILDIAQQYEGWCDFPQEVDVPDLDAVDFVEVMNFLWDLGTDPGAQNAVVGANTLHTKYDHVSANPDSPRSTKYVEGNSTYVLTATSPLPIVNQLFWFYTTAQKRKEDDNRRGAIEGEYDRPMATPSPYELTGARTLAELDERMKLAGENRAMRRSLKKSAPTMRFWKNKSNGDAGAVYSGRIHRRDTNEYEFPMKKNFSSAGRVVVRADHYVAKWVQRVPNTPTECKNILITVDLYGGRWRWSGLLHHWDLETRDGVDYLTMSFNDDLQFVQFMLAPPNPLLPISIFQFPREWPMFGPSVWCISTLILLQLIRLEGNLWTLPDDPFDLDSWIDSYDWSAWQVHIKASDFGLDDSLWTFISSRMNTVDSTIAAALDDGQLSLEYRRIITDDGETVTGLSNNNVKNCALVLEVKDKSGFTVPGGSFFSGSAAGGFLRSIVQWTDGFTGDFFKMVSDDETLYPDEYFQQSFLGSLASTPANCLRDSHWMDLQSKVTWSPATASSVIVGGNNPTVDAIVELMIQATGNLLGYFLLGGFDSLGDIAADVIMPFLQGTIFAWDQFENSARAQNLGWMHLWEIYQQGAEANAWSLAALAAARGGYKGTESQTCHTMVVDESSWFIPGLHGTIGDRTGSTSGALQRNAQLDVMFVNQIEEMGLRGDGSGAYDFTMKIGQNKAAMSTGERLAGTMKRFSDWLNNVGVQLTS